MDREYESFLNEIGGGGGGFPMGGSSDGGAKSSADDEYANFMASIGESTHTLFLSIFTGVGLLLTSSPFSSPLLFLQPRPPRRPMLRARRLRGPSRAVRPLRRRREAPEAVTMVPAAPCAVPAVPRPCPPSWVVAVVTRPLALIPSKVTHLTVVRREWACRATRLTEVLRVWPTPTASRPTACKACASPLQRRALECGRLAAPVGGTYPRRLEQQPPDSTDLPAWRRCLAWAATVRLAPMAARATAAVLPRLRGRSSNGRALADPPVYHHHAPPRAAPLRGVLRFVVVSVICDEDYEVEVEGWTEDRREERGRGGEDLEKGRTTNV